ncbi:MAG: hypothetical protein JST65_07980 [Acidobacteria bacterium]|nr:hypothetical protein [Acidobacteriota bacterium]
MNLFWQAIAAIAVAVTRPPVLLLGSLLGFGILIPLRYGPTFGESKILAAYPFLPMVFVAAPIAFGMPLARETTRKLYTWLAAGIVTGVILWAVFLTVALVTLAAVSYPILPVFPARGTLLRHALLCAASCWFSASVSAYLALLFSPDASRNATRVLFLAALLWMLFGPGLLTPRLRWYLPEISLESVVATALLFSAGLTNALRASANRPVDQTSS